MRTLFVLIPFLLSACGSGFPEIGAGPAFSSFDPSLSPTEIHDAMTDEYLVDLDLLGPNDSLTVDCPNGGTATGQSQGSVSNGTVNATFNSCGVSIFLRGDFYDIFVTGSGSIRLEVTGSTYRLSGGDSLTVSGDLGFGSVCEYNATYSNIFSDPGSESETCTYRDGEGTELVYESSL